VPLRHTDVDNVAIIVDEHISIMAIFDLENVADNGIRRHTTQKVVSSLQRQHASAQTYKAITSTAEATYILELERINMAIAMLEVIVQRTLDLLAKLITRLCIRYTLDHTTLATINQSINKHIDYYWIA
jgi:hypothetical protein